MASNEKERARGRGGRRTRLMGPLRRDGFLLNAEPLAHVRLFHTIPGRPFFPYLSLCPVSSYSARPHQSANHNFYQSHLRVTIAGQSARLPGRLLSPSRASAIMPSSNFATRTTATIIAVAIGPLSFLPHLR